MSKPTLAKQHNLLLLVFLLGGSQYSDCIILLGYHLMSKPTLMQAQIWKFFLWLNFGLTEVFVPLFLISKFLSSNFLNV